jgi:hypothetical protein
VTDAASLRSKLAAAVRLQAHYEEAARQAAELQLDLAKRVAFAESGAKSMGLVDLAYATNRALHAAGAKARVPFPIHCPTEAERSERFRLTFGTPQAEPEEA